MLPAIAPSESRSGVVATLTSSRRVPVVPRDERHAVEGRAFGRLGPRRPQHVEEPRLEDLVEPARDGLLVAHAVQLLEAPVPADDPVVAIDDREAVVERLEDVLAELAHPLELVRLDPELAVEPAVLERGGRLGRDRRQQGHVLAAQRLAARLPAERHHRDGPFLRDARHEVVDPGVAPEVDFPPVDPAMRQGIVERQRVPGDEPRADLRRSLQRRRLTAEPDVGDRDELPVAACRHRRQQQRHPIDDERFHHAVDEPLAQTEQVEVAVQIAREADEGPPIVVPIAVVHAVEAGLDRILHGPREEHHDERRQQRNHRVVFLVPVAQEHLARQLQQHRVHRRNGRDRRRVDQRALDDDLDVHQAIADDRRGEGERHEPEQHRRQLESADRAEPQAERERIAEHERHRAERRAPDDPAELPARRDGSHAPERANHDREPGDEAGAQTDQLDPVHQREHAREHRGVIGRPQERRRTRAAEQQAGKVQERQKRPAGVAARPGVGPFGEHQREVHEQRRQQQHRDDVRPVEHPVQRIEPPGKRKREHPEKRDRQPEEVQRGLVVGPAEPHARADEQREDPDRREHVIQAARARRNRRQRNLEHLARLRPRNHIGERRPRRRRVKRGGHITDRVDQSSVDRLEDVPLAQSHAHGGRSLGHLAGDDRPFGRLAPQDAVLQFAPRGPHGDVDHGEAEQRHDDGELGRHAKQGATSGSEVQQLAPSQGQG